MDYLRKFGRAIALALAVLLLHGSCASTTMIRSEPKGAKLYLNDEYMGRTPYKHRDKKIAGSETYVTLKEDGYKTFETSFKRNEQAHVGAIIFGVFLLVPFLWLLKYKPERIYEMEKGSDPVPEG